MPYTAIAHPEAEKILEKQLEQIVRYLREQLPPKQRCQILLAGSYGRGEGGVLLEDQQVKLHNNLDIVLIAQDRAAAQELQAKLHTTSKVLTEKLQLGIDLSASWPWQVWRNKSQLFWHDTLRHHTLLEGPSMRLFPDPFSRKQPSLGQGLILVVNRATLLLINALLLSLRNDPTSLSTEHVRLLKKHQIKATIGLADAFFLVAGRYTPSYKARLQMLKKEPSLLPLSALRERTIDAIHFRFQPAYLDLSAHALQQDNAFLLNLCRETLAMYEWKRRGLSFDSRRPLRGYSSVLPPSQRLLSAFKQGLQGHGLSNRNDRIVQSFLQECFRDPLDPNKLRDYLCMWGGFEDKNFSHFLDRYQLASLT